VKKRAVHVVHGGATRANPKREYFIWRAMRSRCHSEADPSFGSYGGRGLRVCDRWRADFAAFFADMGPKPDRHSLDRIDNNRGYDCGECDDCASRGAAGNCRWATPKQQARNTRTNVEIEHDGRRMCVSAWAAEMGLHHATLHHRLARGWSVAEALSTPPLSNSESGRRRGSRAA
jgi:hypothetical protein